MHQTVASALALMHCAWCYEDSRTQTACATWKRSLEDRHHLRVAHQQDHSHTMEQPQTTLDKFRHALVSTKPPEAVRRRHPREGSTSGQLHLFYRWYRKANMQAYTTPEGVLQWTQTNQCNQISVGCNTKLGLLYPVADPMEGHPAPLPTISPSSIFL